MHDALFFGLDAAQHARLAAWLEVQHAALVAQQEHDPEMARHIFEVDGKKHPYLGAIGGALTYEFTPTGLGVVTRVTFCKSMPAEATIDLTDYDEW